MDELDHILADQFHAAQRRLKRVKRMRKIMYQSSPEWNGVESSIKKQMLYCEMMINDKSLIIKKRKRKKQAEVDILARNPVVEWYRNTFMVFTYGYKMFADSMTEYVSYFKKGKK